MKIENRERKQVKLRKVEIEMWSRGALWCSFTHYTQKFHWTVGIWTGNMIYRDRLMMEEVVHFHILQQYLSIRRKETGSSLPYIWFQFVDPISWNMGLHHKAEEDARLWSRLAETALLSKLSCLCGNMVNKHPDFFPYLWIAYWVRKNYSPQPNPPS